MVWPENSGDIPDREPSFLTACLPLEFAGKPPSQQETMAKELAASEVVDGFYSFLGFPRLLSSAAIGKAVVRGVEEGRFAYTTGPKPALGSNGKFEVAVGKIRFKTTSSEDEIDLKYGFLILPRAIPETAADGDGKPTPVVSDGGTPQPAITPSPSVASPLVSAPPVKPTDEKVVELTFEADRNQLYTAWNAVADLADLVGKVKVRIHAESEKSFDKGKLRNGVLEPLREANLIE